MVTTFLFCMLAAAVLTVLLVWILMKLPLCGDKVPTRVMSAAEVQSYLFWLRRHYDPCPKCGDIRCCRAVAKAYPVLPSVEEEQAFRRTMAALRAKPALIHAGLETSIKGVH